MADNIILQDSSGFRSPINLIDQETKLSVGAEKPVLPKLDPALDYVQDVEGKSFMDLKDNTEFQKDLVRFFNGGRYNYTRKEIMERGAKGLAEEFVEHMRFQDTNEATAVKDLFYARDSRNNTPGELAAFGRLMSAWDGSERGGTGTLTAAGDYAAGILSAPSTWASLIAIPATLGAGAVAGQLAKQTAKKGIQLKLRQVLSEIIAKKTGSEVLKKSVLGTTLKGAGAGVVVEGALGYGQIETQEATREEVIDDFVGMTPGQKALATGLQAAFGGVTAGFGSWLNVKSANSAIDTLFEQQQKIDEQVTAGAKNALATLSNSLTDPRQKKKVGNVLARIGEMTKALEVRIAKKEGRKAPLSVEGVAEGKDILNEIFAEKPNTNVIGGLSSQTLQSITAATLEIVDKLEIGPNERISSAIAKAIAKPEGSAGSINPREITDILDSYAITREEFSNVYLAELSKAGTTLGQASIVSRALDQVKLPKSRSNESKDVQALLSEITELGKVGISTIDDILARQEVDLASKSPLGVRLYKGVQELDAVRIGFMTSQLATTARNVGFSVARLGVDASDQVFRSILTGTARAVGSDIPHTPARNTFTMLRGMTYDKDMALVARTMLENDMPAVYKKLFRDTSRVEVATNSQTFLSRSSTFVNTLNSATDHVFKQAAFYASLDRQLAEAGSSFLEFSKSGKTLLEVDPNILERAGRDALDFTFQKGYEDSDTVFGMGANAIITLNRKLPFVVSGAAGMPFPRYVANHMEFMFDYIPLLGGAKGISEKLAQKYYSPDFVFSKDKGQLERWSKQMTGTMMFTGAYYARSTQEGETDFSDFKFSEDGDVSKMGPILGAMGGHALAADLLYRYVNDIPFPTTKSWLSNALEVTAGMGSLGFNTGVVKSFVESLEQGSFTEGSKRKMADIIATFSYPGATAKDFIAQGDPEKSYTRYNPDMQTDANMIVELGKWGEFTSRASKFLPQFDWLNHAKSINSATSLPRYSPFNSRPIGTINPAMKQIVGIDVRAQSEIQEELSMLGLKEYDLYKNSTVKNPVIRYVVEQRLSETLGKEFARWRKQPQEFLNGEAYDSLTGVDAVVRRSMFSEFVKKQIQDVKTETQDRWNKYKDIAPTSAAGYIRNMYMIDGKKPILGKPRYDMAAEALPKSLGNFTSAEEYLSKSTSLLDELNRRQMLMHFAGVAEDQAKEASEN